MNFIDLIIEHHWRLGLVNDHKTFPMALSKDTVQIAVVMKKDLKDALKLYAETHHWSMSQAAALLIADGLKKVKDSGGDSQAKS